MRKSICFIFTATVFYIGCRDMEKSAESNDTSMNSNITDSQPKPLMPDENKLTNYLDSIKQAIVKRAISDTASYSFLLEGNYSAEGNEGKAYYKNNKIIKIEITFYGETGKAIYYYSFKAKEITVSQQRFNYKTDFTEVKSANDISKSEEINFTTDLAGKIIKGDNEKADLETFLELKKVVPFDLN